MKPWSRQNSTQRPRKALWILAHRAPGLNLKSNEPLAAPGKKPLHVKKAPVASGMMSLLRSFQSLEPEFDITWFHLSPHAEPPLELPVIPNDSNAKSVALGLPRGLLQGHTQRFCNQTLWPLCHQIFQRPLYDLQDWKDYDEANRRTAEPLMKRIRAAPRVKPSPVAILVHDYHFARMGFWLTEMGFTGNLSLFWHIPWPAIEAFRTLPWSREILESLCRFNLVGFHTREDVERYHSCLCYFFGAGHPTNGRHIPAGAAFPPPPDLPVRKNPSRKPARLSQDESRGKRLFVLGIDRIDFTKGLPERFQAIELFLARNPEYLGKMTLLQVACPSRIELLDYQKLASDIRAQVHHLNQTVTPSPRYRYPAIRLIEKVLNPTVLNRLHLRADIMLVTPLHDGMNLVAKEHILARAADPTRPASSLVLSQFAGAIHELPEAIAVHPFSPHSICEGLEGALSLTAPEKQVRLQKMATRLRQWTDQHWAKQLTESTLALSRIEERHANLTA